MSKLNELKRLENDLKNNEELRKKLDEAVKRIAPEGKAQNDGEVMAAAAKELGYDVSIAGLEQAMAEAQELNDTELDAVAGGAKKGDEWCVMDYSCFVPLNHDREGHNNACFADYQCFSIYHH
jgi:predicted ribosomally synthesized peptide with nif11-like leader